VPETPAKQIYPLAHWHSHWHDYWVAHWRGGAGRSKPMAAPAPVAFRPIDRPDIHLTAYRPGLEFPAGMEPALSPAALRVSRIAARIGDQTFLMIDKSHGRIILFANGMPLLSGAALTGASLADQLPPDALSKTYAQEQDLRYRVTPAGRFTVSPGYDSTYGPTLDINEIRGRDWRLAIHTVVLGARAGYRDVRLRSGFNQDKHITEGCINVDADTMRQLTRLLARRGATPLYILPMDDRLISTLF